MAGPYTLDTAGKSASFPTWHAPKQTRFLVQSMDPNNGAVVTIDVGSNGRETVETGPGGTTYIDRSWAGLRMTVTNTRNDIRVPVKVWTE